MSDVVEIHLYSESLREFVSSLWFLTNSHLLEFCNGSDLSSVWTMCGSLGFV